MSNYESPKGEGSTWRSLIMPHPTCTLFRFEHHQTQSRLLFPTTIILNYHLLATALLRIMLSNTLSGISMISGDRQRSGGQAPPVLTIPDEITSAIFLYTLPSFHWTEHKLMRVDIYHSNYFLLDSEISSHQAARNFANVCRSWRRVALSTKGLWSDFIFRPNETMEKKAFENALLLSGKRNLKFAFQADEAASGKSLVWRTLREHMDRCTALAVTILKPSDLNQIYQTLPKAKELSSLTITMGEMPPSTADLLRLDVSAFPKLQQLIQGRVRCGIMNTATLHPPIAQLDRLSKLVLLQETPWTDALEWFASCPNLTFVHLLLSEREPPSGQGQVTLPLLQHLKISFVSCENDEPGNHGYILEHLVFPSLGTLIMDSPNEGRTWRGSWATALRGALVRSSAPLSTLNLRGWLYADAPDIIDILEECRNLSRLSISKLLLSFQVQEALMPKGKDGRLVSEYMPKLESLTILNSTGAAFPINTFLDIVCARSNDAVTDCERLKHVALAMDVLLLNECMPKYNKFPVLQKCCDKGLRFQPPLPVSNYDVFLAYNEAENRNLDRIFASMNVRVLSVAP